MVDALRESWRVLVAGGWLLDLRPLAVDSALEVLGGGESILVGCVNGAPGLAGDVATARALSGSVRAGGFVRERVSYFAFAFYWDTLEELRRFLAAHWQRRFQAPPESSLREAGRVLASRGGARLRVRQVLTLGSYRRLPSDGSCRGGPSPTAAGQ